MTDPESRAWELVDFWNDQERAPSKASWDPRERSLWGFLMVLRRRHYPAVEWILDLGRPGWRGPGAARLPPPVPEHPLAVEWAKRLCAFWERHGRDPRLGAPKSEGRMADILRKLRMGYIYIDPKRLRPGWRRPWGRQVY